MDDNHRTQNENCWQSTKGFVMSVMYIIRCEMFAVGVNHLPNTLKLMLSTSLSSCIAGYWGGCLWFSYLLVLQLHRLLLWGHGGNQLTHHGFRVQSEAQLLLEQRILILVEEKLIYVQYVVNDLPVSCIMTYLWSCTESRTSKPTLANN